MAFFSSHTSTGISRAFPFPFSTQLFFLLEGSIIIRIQAIKFMVVGSQGV